MVGMFAGWWNAKARLVIGALCAVFMPGCPHSSNCDQQPSAAWCLSEATFALSIEHEVVRIDAGQSIDLKVTLERSGDWTGRGPVTIEAMDLPDGISMKAISVPPSQSEAVLTLQADADAEQGVFPLMLTAAPSEPDLSAQEQALDVVVPGAPGELDRTFNFDGQITYARNGEIYETGAAAAEPSGRLWVVFFEKNSSQTRLLHLDPNGTLDDAMSSQFEALQNETNLAASYDIDLVANDRLVISARFTDEASASYQGVIMLTLDGALDTTFGESGIARVDALYDAFEILPRNDDLILKQRGLWASLLYTGQLNTEFFETGSASVSDYYSRGVVRNDQSLLALRYTKPPQARIISSNEITILSSTYAELESRLGDIHASVYDYKIDSCINEPNQAIVCCGYYRTLTQDPPPYHAYVFRLDAQANLDTTFGEDGFIRRVSSGDETHNARSIVAHSNGRFLVGYERHHDPSTVIYSINCYEHDGKTCQGYFATVTSPALPRRMFIDKYDRLIVWGTTPGPNPDGEENIIHIARFWL